MGADVTAFPNERHSVSWLRLAPLHTVSGGKTLVGKNRGDDMGATHFASVMRVPATSLIRSGSGLGAALYRKGMRVATFATACNLAILIYHMLMWGQDYVDKGQALIATIMLALLG